MGPFAEPGFEVAPVVVHDVVQRRQARVGEDRIRHRPMMVDTIDGVGRAASGFSSVEIVVERSARTPGRGSWKSSAVFVGLLPWFVVPPVLGAIGVTGIWYAVGLFVGAVVFVILATVWLVPTSNRTRSVSSRW